VTFEEYHAIKLAEQQLAVERGELRARQKMAQAAEEDVVEQQLLVRRLERELDESQPWVK